MIFYPHQQDAFDIITTEIKNNNGSITGRIVIPTGGGKSFIEAAIIDWQREYNVNTRIHLVLAPRILLANQLIKEFRNFSGATSYRIIAFHSGHYEPEDEAINWNEFNTTQYNDVVEAYNGAIKNDQDLVVFSTYHSMNKLANIDFDTVVADESQYLVSENFGDAWKTITGRVRLLFTATERHTASNNGRGLNNENLFGKRLYEIKATELIRLNLIVPPRLHIMYGDTRSQQDSILSEVIEISLEQDRLTRKELGFSKILFAMKGTDDVKTIEDNIAKIQKALPNHSIFTITSKNGAKIDGINIPRDKFLEELENRKDCLIFHYDILSEGIDVPGITGVCLMRNLGLAKLLQTIGRAVRLFKEHGVNIKRQAWVSIPVINGDEDDKVRVKKFINAIRYGGFDISSEDVTETGKDRHIPEEDGVDDAYGDFKNNFSNLFITNVFHEIEREEFWNDIDLAKTIDDKLNILFN